MDMIPDYVTEGNEHDYKVFLTVHPMGDVVEEKDADIIALMGYEGGLYAITNSNEVGVRNLVPSNIAGVDTLGDTKVVDFTWHPDGTATDGFGDGERGIWTALSDLIVDGEEK